MLRHALVIDFDWGLLAACRELATELALGALGEGRLDGSRAAAARAAGAALLVWKEGDLDAAAVAAARANDLPLWTFTVDDAARARALRDLGVTGIVTNDPAAMAAALAAR